MPNSQSWYLRPVRCTGHPEVPYPELWRLSFTPDKEYVSCGEACGNSACFRCHNFYSDGGVIKSLLGISGQEAVCPSPHLAYETCKESVAMVIRKCKKGRTALMPHKTDYWMELRAFVFEKGCNEKTVPDDPFFKWLDGHLKNGWKQFEKESNIEGQESEVVDEDNMPFTRMYQIFSLTLAGQKRSLEAVREMRKEISKKLKEIKSQWAPKDSPEDAELLLKIKELEEELKALEPEYEGVAERLNADDSSTDKLENVPAPEVDVETMLASADELKPLKHCLASLKREDPELYKFVDATLTFANEALCVAARKKKDGTLKFNDCDIARLLKMPEHTARRGVLKAENWLYTCMKSKGLVEEHSNAR